MLLLNYTGSFLFRPNLKDQKDLTPSWQGIHNLSEKADFTSPLYIYFIWWDISPSPPNHFISFPSLQKAMHLTHCTSRCLLKPKLTPKPILDCSHPMRTRMRNVSNSNSKPLAFADVFKNLVVKARKEAELETAVIEKPKRLFKVSLGDPTPFGATARDGGVNFCIFSSNAVSAALCLVTLSDLQEVII